MFRLIDRQTLCFVMRLLTYPKKNLEPSSLTSPVHLIEILTAVNYNAEQGQERISPRKFKTLSQVVVRLFRAKSGLCFKI